jgi:hypothetical protein
MWLLFDHKVAKQGVRKIPPFLSQDVDERFQCFYAAVPIVGADGSLPLSVLVAYAIRRSLERPLKVLHCFYMP